MKYAILYTKYKFLDSEFAALKKMSGVTNEEDAEKYVDSLSEDKRDVLFSSIAFFAGQHDKIKSKIFNNTANI